MGFKTDIEIAQECKMKPITEIAKTAGIPEEYIAGNDNAIYRELDCPHYVHDYEYEEISKGIRNFIG